MYIYNFNRQLDLFGHTHEIFQNKYKYIIEMELKTT
jgi:hypothetical protein